MVPGRDRTRDPWIASSIPARYHTFVEIDHEITFFGKSVMLNKTSSGHHCLPMQKTADITDLEEFPVKKGFTLTSQDTRSIHESMNRPKTEYEGLSNMNACSFITFFTYMLR